MRRTNTNIFGVLQKELFPLFQTSSSSIPKEYKDFFSEKDYKDFLAIISKYCNENRIRLDLNSGIAKLPEPGIEVKLREIAIDCSESDREEWASIISSYFISKPERPIRLVNRVAKARFNQVAPYLSVRLYPEEYLSLVQFDEFIFRQDLEKTISVLSLDHPYSVENILKHEAEQWGLSNEELFSLGKRNLEEKYKREYVRDFGYIYRFAAEDSFVPSLVFSLKNYSCCFGKLGSIVAIPEKHSLLCVPANTDIDVEIAMQVLIPTVLDCYQASNDKLSKELYWYYNGRFERIVTAVGVSRFSYVLPEELESMMY